MGCDIHFHTEVKINNRWEHYGHPYVSRNYQLFALLADVRNSAGAIQPISKPKGLPKNVSLVTGLSRKYWGADGHSDSWLSATEIVKFEDQWRLLHADKKWGEFPDIEHHLIGYLENSSWAGFVKSPNERPKHIQDIRWVFWFDN